MNTQAPRDTMSRAYREALRGELVATADAGSAPRTSRRPRIVAAVAGVVILAASGTAVAYGQLSHAPVTDRSSARCYSSAVYVAGDDFPGTTVAAASQAAGTARVNSAIDACAAVWRAGILRPGRQGVIRKPSLNRTTAVYPVPHLFSCVMADGAAAVFPGRRSCAAVGLPSAQNVH